MRPTNVAGLASTARVASKQFVRIRLTSPVERLGGAGDIVLVRPGHMRNLLFPTKKAVYLPLPSPAQRARERLAQLQVRSQEVAQQVTISKQEERKSLHKELGAIQLLSLRRKLEQVPAVGFNRATTTKFRGEAGELPQPPLTIQGSISIEDIIDFLRQKGTFTVETEFNALADSTKSVPLNELTNAQILTACELTLLPAQGALAGVVDKLNRIKSTGKFELTIFLQSSNTRIRVPITVQPSATSLLAPGASDSDTSASSSSSIKSTQTRGYATQAGSNQPRMESSMRQKLEGEFNPAEILIRNDSSKHAHHAAMAAQGGGNGETHFFVEVISDKFAGMPQIKRHRAVNALLQHEFELGLHALSLRTKTFAEVDKQSPTPTQELDGTECPNSRKKRTGGSPEEIAERGGSLWSAPQSLLYPTAPQDSPSPSMQEQMQRDREILDAFYTKPPKAGPVTATARREDAVAQPITDRERKKFFRRVTKNEQVLPTNRQNWLNILGACLAASSATFMVLFADFDNHSIPNRATGRAENCFTPIRDLVFGRDSLTDQKRMV